MNPAWTHHIATLLSEWRACTLQESDAIRSREWGRLEEAQQSKQDIMRSFAELQPDADAVGADLPGEFSPLLNELLEMEKANAASLDKVQAETRDKLGEVRITGRQLSRIKSAYGVSRDSVMLRKYT